jgi:DNA-binding CsgD family transcriptional regulator
VLKQRKNRIFIYKSFAVSSYSDKRKPALRTSYKYIVFSALFTIFFSVSSTGAFPLQEVKSFEKQTYGAASQNWSVSCASDGFLYFANHQGLLEFDGTTWKLYPLPSQTILRAVHVCADTVIYTSGYMELGYWKPDRYGSLYYHSLTGKANEYFSQNIEFWNIALSGETVYFHSFSRVLAYRSGAFALIDLPDFTSVMNKVNDKVLIAVRNSGIYQLVGDRAEPYLIRDFFIDKLVRFLIPLDEEKLLIGTASHGIYVWDGKEISVWNAPWRDYFIRHELNRGFRSANGQIILGTIIDGMTVFNREGQLIKKITMDNGLPNNTVLGIDCDNLGNTWLALDNGIGFVSGQEKRSYTIEPAPGVGAVYSIALFQDQMYLGTNQGLFTRPIPPGNETFRLIPGTQGQIWDCTIIDDKLLVGHNQGTFLLDETGMKTVSRQSGGFAIKKDILNDTLWIQCTYSNLVTYKKQGNTLTSKSMNGFYDLIRYIETDHLGNIWASHMHLGIYKIQTDERREQITHVTYYGEESFGTEYAIHVFNIENRIVFTSGEKIFTYDDLNDSIIPYDLLNKKLGKYSKSHRIIEAPNHHYWFIFNEGIGLFEINQEKMDLIREYPASLFSAFGPVSGFENILPLSEKKALFGLQNGIATLDATVPDSLALIEEFKPQIRQFSIYTARGKSELLPLEASGIKIKNNYHNLHFRFSFPHISELPIAYQYYLEGLHADWSEDTETPEFRFERLPKGKYTLKVKAIDLWDNESQVSQLQFEILPPWYTSGIVLILYLIGGMLMLLGFRNLVIRQTKRKEKLRHDLKEQELIRLRNEKLRNEIGFKSKELANSTMALIKKNEFLMYLKKVISKQKSDLGSRYPDKYFNYLNEKIDENISNQDDWQLFETNFEQAHEQFFRKIKEKYPDLTSSDLRLCAFLRMNLSSKEIAPLLGISVRGVENHRYRLRKKLNLVHDQALTDCILAI